MAIKFAWIASRGKSLDRMLDDLRLERTGVAASEPEAEYSGLMLEGGWAVILNNFGDGGKGLLFEPLARVRAGCEGVCAHMNETTMMSLIYGFSGDVDTGASSSMSSRRPRTSWSRASRAASAFYVSGRRRATPTQSPLRYGGRAQ